MGHATAEIYNSEFTHRIPLTLLAKLEAKESASQRSAALCQPQASQ